MKKKSKRSKFSQFSFETEPKPTSKKDNLALEEVVEATTSEEILKEPSNNLCDVIKELCKRNNEWEKHYDTPFFATPTWFEAVVKILGKDLNVE